MRRECQCLGEAGPSLTPGACSAQPDRQLRGLQGGSRIPPASPKEASPWEWTQLNGFSGGHLASPAGLSLFLSIEADVPRVFLDEFSPEEEHWTRLCLGVLLYRCCWAVPVPNRAFPDTPTEGAPAPYVPKSLQIPPGGKGLQGH